MKTNRKSLAARVAQLEAEIAALRRVLNDLRRALPLRPAVVLLPPAVFRTMPLWKPRFWLSERPAALRSGLAAGRSNGLPLTPPKAE